MNVRLWKLRNLIEHRPRGVKQELMKLAGIGLCAELRIVVYRGNGTIDDLGVVSRRVITDAGATKVADAFTNAFEPELFNYHAAGTGVVAEAVGDTLLGLEVEARATGTQSKPSAKVYQSVGTVAFTATRAITEHGIFSVVTANTITLLDRSVFSVINVVNTDSIAFTYQLTVPSGG